MFDFQFHIFFTPVSGYILLKHVIIKMLKIVLMLKWGLIHCTKKIIFINKTRSIKGSIAYCALLDPIQTKTLIFNSTANLNHRTPLIKHQ